MTATYSTVLVFIVVLVCSLVHTPISAAEEFHSTSYGYQLDLPPGWVEIPKDVLEATAAAAQKGDAATRIAFDAAFQPESANNWFEYPYVLVQRIPYDGHRQINEDEFPKLIRLLAGLDLGQTIDEVASSDVRKLIDNVDAGPPQLDTAHRRFLWTVSMDVQPFGPSYGLVVGYFGRDSLVQVNFYSRRSDWDRYADVRRAIVDSFRFDPHKAYSVQVAAVNPTPPSIWSRALEKAVIGAVMGGILGLVFAAIAAVKRKKRATPKDADESRGVSAGSGTILQRTAIESSQLSTPALRMAIPKGVSHMRIHIRPRYQPQQELSLEEINVLLRKGELDGDEPAWTVGLEDWTALRTIDGVRIPLPPATLATASDMTPPPFRPEIISSRSSPEAPPTPTSQRTGKGGTRGAALSGNDLNRSWAPTTMTTTYTYRDMTGVTKFLRVLLGLSVAIAVVSLFSSFMQAELLSRSSFSVAEGQANDSREQFIGVLQLALYVFTVVIFGRWIVRANKNIRALGADDLRITPGWAVGYFFIPIVCLWRPYQAMKDLWQASQDPTAWHSTPAGSILPAWWTLWLLSNFFGQLSFRLTMNARGVKDFLGATYVQMVCQALDIALCLVAMGLVLQIARAQNAHARINT